MLNKIVSSGPDDIVLFFYPTRVEALPQFFFSSSDVYIAPSQSKLRCVFFLLFSNKKDADVTHRLIEFEIGNHLAN